jgi:hypothetical protein
VPVIAPVAKEILFGLTMTACADEVNVIPQASSRSGSTFTARCGTFGLVDNENTDEESRLGAFTCFYPGVAAIISLGSLRQQGLQI